MLAPGFYLMDCMEGMRTFPDQFFDLAIVDPPYGINADKFNNGASSKRGSTAQRLNHGCGKLAGRVLNQSNCSWDTEPPGPEYFEELRRVSKNQIIWGGNYYNLPPTRCVIAWDKVQPWENFSQFELAWTSFDKPAALFRYCNTNGANAERRDKIHPTQKPTALYTWILNKFAKPGDRILDTHCGSASSLIACHRAGFEAWGFEINEQYYRAAKERLDREKAQVSILDLLGG